MKSEGRSAGAESCIVAGLCNVEDSCGPDNLRRERPGNQQIIYYVIREPKIWCVTNFPKSKDGMKGMFPLGVRNVSAQSAVQDARLA